MMETETRPAPPADPEPTVAAAPVATPPVTLIVLGSEDAEACSDGSC